MRKKKAKCRLRNVERSKNHKYILLFVGDEKSILNSPCHIFCNENHKILFVNSGAETLEVLKENEVPIIISDQRTPGMDGA